MTLFRSISIRHWRQFANIEIDLSRQTTVLTGSNGSGKTTLLNALSHHFGWNLSFVSTPYLGRRTAKRIWSDIYDPNLDQPDDSIPDGTVEIGRVQYLDGPDCQLLINRYVSANYQLQYHNMQGVPGLFIPSHTPVATYHPVENIPTNPVAVQKHYQDYRNLLQRAFNAQPRQNPGLIQKQSIIALALFGEGNSAVASSQEYWTVFNGFQEKLKQILPADIGFRRIEVRMPEVVLVTTSGDFALDAMSGGLNALFGIALANLYVLNW